MSDAISSVSGNTYSAVSGVSRISSHANNVHSLDFQKDKNVNETAGSLAHKSDNLFDETAGSLAYKSDNLFDETAGSLAYDKNIEETAGSLASGGFCIAA